MQPVLLPGKQSARSSVLKNFLRQKTGAGSFLTDTGEMLNKNLLQKKNEISIKKCTSFSVCLCGE